MQSCSSPVPETTSSPLREKGLVGAIKILSWNSINAWHPPTHKGIIWSHIVPECQESYFGAIRMEWPCRIYPLVVEMSLFCWARAVAPPPSISPYHFRMLPHGTTAPSTWPEFLASCPSYTPVLWDTSFTLQEALVKWNSLTPCSLIFILLVYYLLCLVTLPGYAAFILLVCDLWE